MEFQAKDIQRLLKVPKHRYEYIASKIRIIPEILEVEGQGRTHLYSFKNLLQFAIANRANDTGLTPKAIQRMFDFFDKAGEKPINEIFNPGEVTDCVLFFIAYRQYLFFALGNLKYDKNRKYNLQFLHGQIHTEYLDEDQLPKGPGVGNWVDDTFEFSPLDVVLRNAESYIAVNVGSIKRLIVNEINNE